MLITYPKTLISTFSIFLGLNCFSQDIIVTKKGDSLSTKVEEINFDNITFKKTKLINGPLYTLPKSEINKIIFDNGVIEYFVSDEHNSTKSIEELKRSLKQKIDLYAYNRSGRNSIIIEYEGNLIRFYLKGLDPYSEPHKQFLYDFSKECLFHTLSKRNKGIAFINAKIPRKISDTKLEWSNNYKLVLRIHGHEEGEEILKLMKAYHKALSGS